MIKVGVIGTGTMGRHHARIYAELPDVELAGIADINTDTVYAIAKRYNTKPFTDYNKLLSYDLDAVSIAVPTSLHKQVAIDTANAGINMLIEKPIADTVENATAIIDSARNVKLMIGHVERFNPIISVIRNIIEDVISIDITRVGPFPPRVRDTGVVIDLAIHDIDLIRYLTNSEFNKIYSVTSDSNNEDAAFLSFEMENGILAHITTNWLTPFKIREINIATRTKFIKGLFIDQKVLEYSKYKEDMSYTVKELNVPFSEPLKAELESFLASVKNNTEPVISGKDGLNALEIAVRCLNC